MPSTISSNGHHKFFESGATHRSFLLSDVSLSLTQMQESHSSGVRVVVHSFVVAIALRLNRSSSPIEIRAAGKTSLLWAATGGVAKDEKDAVTCAVLPSSYVEAKKGPKMISSGPISANATPFAVCLLCGQGFENGKADTVSCCRP